MGAYPAQKSGCVDGPGRQRPVEIDALYAGRLRSARTGSILAICGKIGNPEGFQIFKYLIDISHLKNYKKYILKNLKRSVSVNDISCMQSHPFGCLLLGYRRTENFENAAFHWIFSGRHRIR